MGSVLLLSQFKKFKGLIGLLVGLISILTMVTPSQAYTVLGTKWAIHATYYVKDASYTSQGTNWASIADRATKLWTTYGAFGFVLTSSSSNHIQAANIASSCNHCLAKTTVTGNPLNKFTLVVNIGDGYGFYDGTQGSTIPSNYYDLKSVILHELGHAQGLCHTINPGYLMWPVIYNGQVMPLDTDATNGSKYLYQSGYNGPGPDQSTCFH
jgi:hypothetical protein